MTGFRAWAESELILKKVTIKIKVAEKMIITKVDPSLSKASASLKAITKASLTMIFCCQKNLLDPPIVILVLF